MKKLLSIMGSIALASGGLLTALAFDKSTTNSHHQPSYDPFDLSTWGSDQKKVMTNIVIKNAQEFITKKTNPQWKDWVAQTPTSYYSTQDLALLEALKFNNNIILDSSAPSSARFGNVSYVVEDNNRQIISNDSTKLLSSYLKSGLFFVLTGHAALRQGVPEIFGSLTLHVTTNSHPGFQQNDLSTWGDAQKQYISSTLVKGAETFLKTLPKSQWKDWALTRSYMGYIKYILQGFQHFNPNIKSQSNVPNEGNINFVTLDSNGKDLISYEDQRQLSTIFTNGFYLIVRGVSNPFEPFMPITGEITIFIQSKLNI